MVLRLVNPSPPGHCWQVIWASSVDGQTMYPAIATDMVMMMMMTMSKTMMMMSLQYKPCDRRLRPEVSKAC